MGGVFIKLLMLAAAGGIVVGNKDKLQEFYHQLEAKTQCVVTAMDMRNISNMLDYHRIQKDRYPRAERFAEWMRENFKENSLRELGKDTWGNDFIYETSDGEKQFSLICTGPDGARGTDDDIVYTGP